MLDKLEYSEIIKLISNYCKTYIGKETVLKLSPCFDSDEVSHLLEETTEAMDINIKKSNIPVCEIPNIDIWIKQLESSNILSAKALLDVASILKVSRELKTFFFSDASFDTTNFPIMFDYFNSLYVNKNAFLNDIKHLCDGPVSLNKVESNSKTFTNIRSPHFLFQNTLQFRCF